jgi:acetylornithine/N-succinyldiaminopimelate aminotransferase
LKLARKWSRSNRSEDAIEIVAAEGGFHGRTFGALAATGQPAKRAPFEPLPPGFRHVPYGDPNALAAAVNERTAAVLLEPIQGESGVIVPPRDYLTAALEISHGAGALLILDEIQTGLGRTGEWLGAHHFGVEPDMILLGKAIAGGLPMGVCLARPAVAEAFSVGDHGSTFGGGPVQASAALAVLDVIESEGLVARARTAGARLMAGLRRVAPHTDVRGMGLLIGVEFNEPVARRVTELALERGVLVNNATDYVVRLCPPLVITDEDIDTSIDVLGEVMAHEAATT